MAHMYTTKRGKNKKAKESVRKDAKQNKERELKAPTATVNRLKQKIQFGQNNRSDNLLKNDTRLRLQGAAAVLSDSDDSSEEELNEYENENENENDDQNEDEKPDQIEIQKTKIQKGENQDQVQDEDKGKGKGKGSGQASGQESRISNGEGIGLGADPSINIHSHQKEIANGIYKDINNPPKSNYKVSVSSSLQVCGSSLCPNIGPSAKGLTYKICSQCQAIAYCSKECQANDWRSGHKKKCLKADLKALEAKLFQK